MEKEHYNIFILNNTAKDLSVFKFEKCKIVDVKSAEFIEFLEKTDSIKKEFISVINEEILIENKKMYALMGKDDTTVSLNLLHRIFHFLKILFPSKLEIRCFVTYIQPNLEFFGAYFREKNHNTNENLLYYDDDKVSSINLFIQSHFKDYLQDKFIHNTSINYMNAYEASHVHFTYLALCISFEGLIEATNELLYRISRGIAILCGDNLENSKIIFKNISKIYALRSKIIHGSNFEYEKVNEYLYYLECISSKIMVELLIHKIEIKDLNNKFTELGFGQRQNISSNWYNFVYNKRLESVIIQELKK